MRKILASRALFLLALFAYLPTLLVLVEVCIAVCSNFLFIDQVGGSDIPSYISVPLFILCVFGSFSVSLLLTTKAYNMSVARYIKVLTSLFTLLHIVLLGVYGYLRTESSGVIVYKWDTIVGCCTPSGDVSGLYLIASSVSAMLGMIGCKAFHLINHFRNRNSA